MFFYVNDSLSAQASREGSIEYSSEYMAQAAAVTDTVNYVSLGDSIAVGYALDSWRANGEKEYGDDGVASTPIYHGSYTQRIANELATAFGGVETSTNVSKDTYSGKIYNYSGNVNVVSYARSGDKITDLLDKIEFEQEVQDSIRSADVVTICIGANNILSPALERIMDFLEKDSGVPLETMLSSLSAGLVQAKYDFPYLLETLQGINPNAQYIFTTVYNPFRGFGFEGEDFWIGVNVNDFIDFIPGLDIPIGVTISEDDLVEQYIQKNRVNIIDPITEAYLSGDAIQYTWEGETYTIDLDKGLNDIICDSIEDFGNNNFTVVDAYTVFKDRPNTPALSSSDQFRGGPGTSRDNVGCVNAWLNKEKGILSSIRELDSADWGNKVWDPTLDDVGDYIGDIGWGWANDPTGNIGKTTQYLGERFGHYAGKLIEEEIVLAVDPHPSINGHAVLKDTFREAIKIIKFDAKGGTLSTSGEVSIGGNKVDEPLDPSRTGYTFSGWYKQSACTTPWNFDTDTVSSDTTIYAKWTPNPYTITFDPNGGTVVGQATKTVNFDANYGDMPSATRTGYTFTGWYTSASGGTKIETTTKMTTASNHTLYAHWNIVAYTLTVDANGGNTYKNLIDSSTVSKSWLSTDNQSDGLVINYDAATGVYTMSGATSSNDPFVTIKSRASLSANTKYKLHIIPSANMQIFYASGANNSGYSETYSVRPTVNSHTFDITATSAGVYHFRFDPANANAMTAKQFWISSSTAITTTYTQSINYQEYYQIPIPTRANYIFAGWDITGGATVSHDGVVRLSSDATIKAKWTQLTCSSDATQYVKSIGNAAVVNFSINPDNGSTIKWYDNDNAISGQTGKTLAYKPTTFGSHEIYCNVDGEKSNEFTIRYYQAPSSLSINASGTSNTYSLTAVHGCTASNLDVTKFTWYKTNPSGTKTKIGTGLTASLEIDANYYTVTLEYNDGTNALTATYGPIKKKFTVSFNTQGGSTAPSNQVIEYNEKVTKPTNPTKTDNIFEGWYRESGCTNKWNFSTDTVTSNMTLYAKWVQLTSTGSLSQYVNNVSAVSFNIALDSSVSVTWKVSDTKQSGTSNTFSFTPTVGVAQSYTVWCEVGGAKSNSITITVNYITITNLSIKTKSQTGNQYTFAFDETDNTMLGLDKSKLTWYYKNTKTNVTESQSAQTRLDLTLTIDEIYDVYAVYTYGSTITSNTITVTPEYTVTFNSNGGSAVSAISKVKKYTTISEPTSPVWVDHIFAGWYKESDCKTKWIFASDEVTSNITLYAKWVQIQCADNTKLSQIVNEVKKVSFTIDLTGSIKWVVQGSTKQEKTDDGTFDFTPTAGVAQSYKVWCEVGGVKSNTITINVVYRTLTSLAIKAKTRNVNAYTFAIDATTAVINSLDPSGFTWYYTNKKTNTTQTQSGSTGMELSLTIDEIYDVYAVYTYTGSTVTSSTITVTPVYTVTFDSQGGSSVASQTCNKYSKATEPTNPTRSTYIFAGWYKESGCTTKWNFASDQVTTTTTLYAKWVQIQCADNTKLSQYLNDVKKVSFTIDLTGSIKWVVQGSTKQEKTDDGTFDFTPTAGVAQSYTVWCEVGGVKSNTITINVVYRTLTSLAIKAKTRNVNAYTFAIDATTAVINSLDPSGFTWYYTNKKTNATQTQSGSTGLELSLNISETYEIYATYTYDGSTVTSSIITVIPVYTVTFDSQGGSSVASQTCGKYSKATEPTNPTRSTYIFAGWWRNNSLWNFNTEITQDITLTAKWVQVRIEGSKSQYYYNTDETITFKIDLPESTSLEWYLNGVKQAAEGVECAINVQTLTVGAYSVYCKLSDEVSNTVPFTISYYVPTTLQIAESNTSTRNTFKFNLDSTYLASIEVSKLSWKQDIDGTITTISNSVTEITVAIDDICKIYLEYNNKVKSNQISIIPKYNVTFMSQGSTVTTKTDINKNTTITQYSITRSDYILAGWYKESDWKTKWDFSSDKVQSDMTLYAKWVQAYCTDESKLLQLVNSVEEVTFKIDLDDSTDVKWCVNLGSTSFKTEQLKGDQEFSFTPNAGVIQTYYIWCHVGGVDSNKLILTFEYLELTSLVIKSEEISQNKHKFYIDSTGYNINDLHLNMLTWYYTNLKTGQTKEISSTTNFELTIDESYEVYAQYYYGANPMSDFITVIPWYTVTFNSNGGSDITAQKLNKYDNAADPNPSPTLKDHIFAGWYQGNDLWDFNTDITQNITLIAKWAQIYTNDTKEKYYKYNSTITYKIGIDSDEVKWYLDGVEKSDNDSNFAIATQSLSLGEHEVYCIIDGQQSQTEKFKIVYFVPTVKTDLNIKRTTMHERNTFKFNLTGEYVNSIEVSKLSWKQDIDGTITTISNSVTEITITIDDICKIYLVYNGSLESDYIEVTPQYIVTFMDGGSQVQQRSIDKNNTLSNLKRTKTDWILAGWYTEESCVNKWNFSSDKVQGDMTLYAKWVQMQYTGSLLHYVNNVSDIEFTIELDADVSVTWRVKQSGAVISTKTQQGSETFLYTPNGTEVATYTVSCIVDSSESNSVEVVVSYLIPDELAIGYVEGERNVYTFSFDNSVTDINYLDHDYLNWYYINESGVETKVSVKTSPELVMTINEKYIVYARYTRDTDVKSNEESITPRYIVTFDSRGGDDVSEQELEKDQLIVEPDIPKQTDYIFIGWYVNLADENVWDFTTGVVEDMKLYAKWAAMEVSGSLKQYYKTTVTVTFSIDLPGSPQVEWYVRGECQQNSSEQTFTVYVYNLNIGDYEVYCIVDGQRSNAMKLSIQYYVPTSLSITSYPTSNHNEYEFHLVDDKSNSMDPNKLIWKQKIVGGSIKDLGSGADLTVTINDISDIYLTHGSVESTSIRIIPKYTVTFRTGSSEDYVLKNIAKGSVISYYEVQKPDNILKGWYRDEGYNLEWNFDYDTVQQDIILYAKWVQLYCVDEELMYQHSDDAKPVRFAIDVNDSVEWYINGARYYTSGNNQFTFVPSMGDYGEYVINCKVRGATSNSLSVIIYWIPTELRIQCVDIGKGEYTVSLTEEMKYVDSTKITWYKRPMDGRSEQIATGAGFNIKADDVYEIYAVYSYGDIHLTSNLVRVLPDISGYIMKIAFGIGGGILGIALLVIIARLRRRSRRLKNIDKLHNEFID